MNIGAAQPFMYQGVSSIQNIQTDFKPETMGEQTGIGSGNEFANKLVEASNSAFSPDSMSIRGNQGITSTGIDHAALQGHQGTVPNQFKPDSVQSTELVQQVSNQPLGLEQLNSRINNTSLMYAARGLNRISNNQEFGNELKEAVQVTKEVAMFRKKKITSAYNKLSQYATKSSSIYA